MTNEEIKDKNRREISNALIKCMSTYGAVGTTKEMIAKKGNLSLSAVSRHFSSKDSMIDYVFDYIEDRMLDACRNVGCDSLDKILTNPTPTIELFEKLLFELKALLFEDPQLFVLRAEVQYHVMKKNMDIHQFSAKYKKAPIIYDVLKCFIEKCKQNGSINKLGDIDFELAYFKVNFCSFLSNVAFNFNFDDKEQRKLASDIVDMKIREVIDRFSIQ